MTPLIIIIMIHVQKLAIVLVVLAISQLTAINAGIPPLMILTPATTL